MSIGTVRVHIRRPLGRAAHLLGRLLGFGAAEVPLVNGKLVREEEAVAVPQHAKSPDQGLAKRPLPPSAP